MKLSSKGNVEIWGGLECTINRVQDKYFDQLTWSGHYERKDDIALLADLGLKKIRYPVLWEYHQSRKDRAIDWSGTETKLNELRDCGIDVIAGLVHHGSGPAHVHITEESFVLGLAAYAQEVAKKFPWIRFYTPVNEPLTTARFCGLYGLWYPHKRDDACFCRILINECKAIALAMEAIRSVNPDALLVQTDDLGKVHSTPALAYQAAFENERRWLAYDLLCGRVNPEHPLWSYLTGNGITPAELNYFIEQPCPPAILGANYYITSERYLDEDLPKYPVSCHGGNSLQKYADVEAVRVGEVYAHGIERLLKEAWERYRLPIAVTEVHLNCTREEQMRWLSGTWLVANRLQSEGIPILAITPWALFGSFGWDNLLTLPGGTYEPGIFDCSSGEPRATILAAMIKAFSRNEAYQHPALDNPGWWDRSCRVVYGQVEPDQLVNPAGRCLAISGNRSALLMQICRQRFLTAVEGDEYRLTDGNCWAVIVVNEEFEVSCFGRQKLVVTLGEDVFLALNVGLDLFLDGESGHWAAGDDGVYRKINTYVPTLRVLASEVELKIYTFNKNFLISQLYINKTGIMRGNYQQEAPMKFTPEASTISHIYQTQQYIKLPHRGKQELAEEAFAIKPAIKQAK